MRKRASFIIVLLTIFLFTNNLNAFAHPGRTDSKGGHWDRSTGTYHYHNGGTSSGTSNNNYSTISESTRNQLTQRETLLQQREQELLLEIQNLESKIDELNKLKSEIDELIKEIELVYKYKVDYSEKYFNMPYISFGVAKIYLGNHTVYSRDYESIWTSSLNFWENDLISAENDIHNNESKILEAEKTLTNRKNKYGLLKDDFAAKSKSNSSNINSVSYTVPNAAVNISSNSNVSYTPIQTIDTAPKLQMVNQPAAEYHPGDRVFFTVTSPNYGGKVEYRVILYNGTTKTTTELWKTPSSGYYYKNWQPSGNYNFTINWPVVGMEPGAYSLTVLVRRVGSKGAYDSFVKTNAFWIKTDSASNAVESGKQMKVHYIDVGQADSILIQTPNGKNMLIDAGNNGDADTITSYLKQLGAGTIDVLVGTHPHEDHIGGMDVVINSFDIGKIYMPKATTTTTTFEDVLNAIKAKELKVTTPIPGTTIDIDSAIKVTILAPNSDSYEDLNNNSIVLKLTYGDKSFLFNGDAEDISENEMINKGYDLKADVLKVGHHGSSSSTTVAFLKKVNPTYAVISVGDDNSYGHPAQSTVDALKSQGVKVYRTDESGTITATCDGKSITFNTNPGSYNGSSSGSGGTITPPAGYGKVVYITNTGTKYHVDGCRYLSKSKIEIKLEDAKAKGFTPCGVCNPPVSYADPVLHRVFLFCINTS